MYHNLSNLHGFEIFLPQSKKITKYPSDAKLHMTKKQAVMIGML